MSKFSPSYHKHPECAQVLARHDTRVIMKAMDRTPAGKAVVDNLLIKFNPAHPNPQDTDTCILLSNLLLEAADAKSIYVKDCSAGLARMEEILAIRDGHKAILTYGEVKDCMLVLLPSLPLPVIGEVPGMLDTLEVQRARSGLAAPNSPPTTLAQWEALHRNLYPQGTSCASAGLASAGDWVIVLQVPGYGRSLLRASEAPEGLRRGSGDLVQRYPSIMAALTVAESTGGKVKHIGELTYSLAQELK